MINNIFAEDLCRHNQKSKPSYLDSNNVLWKVVNGVWVGKRSVQTKDLAVSWVDDINIEEIKKFLCGKYADYKEEFFRS